MTNYYLDQKEHAKALQTIKPFYTGNKNHFQTASLYVRTLTYNKQYAEADKILNTIHILPFEGERGGRLIYREIKMMLAIQALAKGKTKDAGKKVAQASLWPHRLGVGKPYDDLIDTRLEDWMSAMIAIKSKKSAEKELYLKKVAYSIHQAGDHSTLLQCIACWQLDEKQKADNLFAQWSSLQKDTEIQEWGSRFYKNNRDKEYPFDVNETAQLIGFISGTNDLRLF